MLNEHSEAAQRGKNQGMEKTTRHPEQVPVGRKDEAVILHCSSSFVIVTWRDRARFASQPPPSFAFKGRLGFKTLSRRGSQSSSVLLPRCDDRHSRLRAISLGLLFSVRRPDSALPVVMLV